MSSNKRSKKTAAVPKISTEDQIKVFDMVKSGLSIDEALARAKAIESPNSPVSPTSPRSPRDRTTSVSNSDGSDDASLRSANKRNSSGGFIRSNTISGSTRGRRGKKTKSKAFPSQVVPTDEERVIASTTKRNSRSATCAICGSKISVLNTPMESKNFRFHAECVRKCSPAFPRTLTALAAANFADEELDISFSFRGHKFRYCFAAAYPAAVSGTDDDASLDFISVNGDDASPTSQPWPALIAGFGLPVGLEICFGGSYSVFNAASPSIIPPPRNSNMFTATASTWMFGLIYSIEIMMAFQTDECWVAAQFARIRISAAEQGMSIPLSAFQALGGDHATEVTQQGTKDVHFNPETESDFSEGDDDIEDEPKYVHGNGGDIPAPARPAPVPPGREDSSKPEEPKVAATRIPAARSHTLVPQKPAPRPPVEQAETPVSIAHEPAQVEDPLPPGPSQEKEPTDTDDAASRIGLPAPWVRIDGTEHQVYYYNEETEETSWDLPEGSVYWLDETPFNISSVAILPGDDGYGLNLEQYNGGLCRITNRGWTFADGSDHLGGSAMLFCINDVSVVGKLKSDVDIIVDDALRNGSMLSCIVSPDVKSNCQSPSEGITDENKEIEKTESTSSQPVKEEPTDTEDSDDELLHSLGKKRNPFAI